jgi:hypothetical protein
MIEEHLEPVEEWFKAFDVPVDIELQCKLVDEEAEEFFVALTGGMDTRENCAEILKEAADFIFVVTGLIYMMDSVDNGVKPSRETLAHIEGATRILMLLQDRVPMFEEMLDSAFIKVCASNMSKLGDDGKPIRREDGKVLKGPNYALPDLSVEAEHFYLASHVN